MSSPNRSFCAYFLNFPKCKHHLLIVLVCVALPMSDVHTHIVGATTQWLRLSSWANASKLEYWCLRPIQYQFCAHADPAPPHLFKTYTIDILLLNRDIHGACICEANGNAQMLGETNSEVQRPSTYSSRSACVSNGHHRHQFS